MMAELLPIPRRIAIAVYLSLPEGMERAQEISNFLHESGVENVAWGTFQDEEFIQRIEAKEFDLLLALGGDGTMLRAGNLAAPLGLPVLGINLGHFGFLTEIQRGQWRDLLPLLLEGKYRIEERMMLYVEHTRAGKVLDSWHVINEVVVCRGQFVRPVHIQAEVDGYKLTTYVADGLIAATPTGSTAYALAAGGPIMPPDLRNILLIPVAPHLSIDRAIILSEGTGVTMTVYTRHEAVLSVDGRPPVPMLNGDSVHVSVNDFQVYFIRFQDPSYFYRNITEFMEQNPVTGSQP